jgi:hypothetical protein
MIQGPKQPIQPSLNPIPNSKNLEADILKNAKDLLSDLQEELGQHPVPLPITHTMKPLVRKPEDNKQRARINMASAMADNPDVEEALQEKSLETIDAIQRKSRKNRNFDEKLEELANLEGSFDLEALDDHEKGVLASFFSNIKKIRQLKKRKRELEEQEENYKKIIAMNKKNKDDKKNSES